MGSFDSGVSSYVRGRAVVEQFWPVDLRGNADINCTNCFYFREASRRCGITGEVTAYPNKYVGNSCPMLNDDDFKKSLEGILDD